MRGLEVRYCSCVAAVLDAVLELLLEPLAEVPGARLDPAVLLVPLLLVLPNSLEGLELDTSGVVEEVAVVQEVEELDPLEM